MPATTAIAWTGQIITAALLGMTLPAKFGGAEEAIATFTALGVEPWGRLTLGGIEALTVVLLLIPATAAIGAAVGVGLMLGAIAAHAGPLGFAPNGDPSLFIMALVALAASGTALWLRRSQLPLIGARFQTEPAPQPAS